MVTSVCAGYRRSWIELMRVGLFSLLRFCEQEPALARLCVIDAMAAGHEVLERRNALLKQVASAVDHGRAATRREPPPLAAEGVVGAVFAVIHTRLLEDDQEPLTGLVGPLMSMIVLPYRGRKAASLELSRPVVHLPRRPPKRAPTSQDPLRGLGIRVTYRTVRVLAVICERPGMSNREIADGSGVIDQGQISKLLTRLARLNLIENTGEGQMNGGANAWRLTQLGVQVERATRTYGAP
jgi:hypothetical protein